MGTVCTILIAILMIITFPTAAAREDISVHCSVSPGTEDLLVGTIQLLGFEEIQTPFPTDSINRITYQILGLSVRADETSLIGSSFLTGSTATIDLTLRARHFLDPSNRTMTFATANSIIPQYQISFLDSVPNFEAIRNFPRGQEVYVLFMKAFQLDSQTSYLYTLSRKLICYFK